MLIRPYIYHELPGWGRLFNYAGIGGIKNTNSKWRDAPTRLMRGKGHGYTMRLKLADDMDRMTYFLGRNIDSDVQRILDTILKPGDTFVDVGANVGRTTLHGAARVGVHGKVISFEPQPECCERIREAISDNEIKHVTLHNVGLSDMPAELKLKVLGGGSVMATFAVDDTDIENIREEVTVGVDIGDNFLLDRVVGDLMIKIDVEGFELQALRGLSGTIERHKPPVLTEIEPRFLRRAGVDEAQVFAWFHQRGYRGYALGLRGRGKQSSPTLRPVAEAVGLRHDVEHDVLWLHPQGPHFDSKPFLI